MTRGFFISRSEICDVTVVGGGIAGVMAALASASTGVNTILIEEQAFLGGQATAGGVHTFCGETRLVNDSWSTMLEQLGALGGLADYDPNRDCRAFVSAKSAGRSGFLAAAW